MSTAVTKSPPRSVASSNGVLKAVMFFFNFSIAFLLSLLFSVYDVLVILRVKKLMKETIGDTDFAQLQQPLATISFLLAIASMVSERNINGLRDLNPTLPCSVVECSLQGSSRVQKGSQLLSQSMNMGTKMTTRMHSPSISLLQSLACLFLCLPGESYALPYNCRIVRRLFLSGPLLLHSSLLGQEEALKKIGLNQTDFFFQLLQFFYLCLSVPELSLSFVAKRQRSYSRKKYSWIRLVELHFLQFFNTKYDYCFLSLQLIGKEE